MNAFDFDDVVTRVIHNTSPTEITDGAAKYLNSLPAEKVVPALIKLFEAESDELARSRTVDALMKIDNLDKVAFLVERLDTMADLDWRYGIAMRLGDFPDPRAVEKLVEILRHDPNPDMRFVSAESLGQIGDASAIEALEHAAAHDFATDYEGVPVSRAAALALETIHARLSASA